jgi:hypothetical protein
MRQSPPLQPVRLPLEADHRKDGYPKSKKDDLSPSETAILRNLVKEL